jgi:hypothetical protein
VRRGEPALRRPRSGAVALLVTVSVVLASACAQGAGTPTAGETSGLEARARKYLELKQRHAWAEIYDEILDPEARKTLERQRFLKKRENAFDILGFEVVSTEQKGQEGRVRVKMEAMIPIRNPGGETSLVRKNVQDPQTWVYRDGRWYIRLEG